MKAIGIIIAKENSIRFPGKNYHDVEGKPMFLHAVNLLRDSKYIEKIVIATDSKIIKKYCKDMTVIHRSKNITRDEQPFFEVLKFTYQSMSKRYDIIVSVLANSIEHTSGAVDKAIEKMMSDDHISEIRSFDNDGEQSGIFLLRESVILEQHETSQHMASVLSTGREIHYEDELNG